MLNKRIQDGQADRQAAIDSEADKHKSIQKVVSITKKGIRQADRRTDKSRKDLKSAS